MAMESAAGVTARAGLGPAAALFRSLADPARLAIVRRLAGGEARVVDLTGRARPGPVHRLQAPGLPARLPPGRRSARPGGRRSTPWPSPRCLDLLAAAEDLLAATGNAVALCPAYGPGPVSRPPDQLAGLRRRGFRLEYASVAWMVAEAAVAVTAGVIAASIALTGFGLDSVIELFAAAIVIWQLRGEIAGRTARPAPSG